MENKIPVERWEFVKGYEGLYEVSDSGKVRNAKGKLLKNQLTPKRRLRVTLYKNGISKVFFVHRLVGFSFVDNPDNKPEINHKDGNPTNNSYGNLEWSTGTENVQHAWATGLINPRTVSKEEKEKISKRHRKVSFIFDIISGDTVRFSSLIELCIAYNISKNVGAMAIRKNRLVKGRYLLSFNSEFVLKKSSVTYHNLHFKNT